MADENLLNEQIEDEVDDSDSALNDPVEDSVHDALVMTVPIDPTLTQSMVAAEAKATGDAIESLRAEITGDIGNIETEMSDFEGSVQGQIDDLSEEVTGQIEDLTQSIGTRLDEFETEVEGEIDAIPEIMFPVGSIYMTTNASVPAGIPGTWTEILIPMTWNDLKNGTRNWQEAGQTGGTVHFFLRTE